MACGTKSVGCWKVDLGGSVNGDAFFKAVAVGKAAMVNAFLSRGANPNTAVNGQTVLALAMHKGHKDVVALLLAHGADPNLPSLIVPGGSSEAFDPLVIAEQRGLSDIQQILMDVKR